MDSAIDLATGLSAAEAVEHGTGARKNLAAGLAFVDVDHVLNLADWSDICQP